MSVTSIMAGGAYWTLGISKDAFIKGLKQSGKEMMAWSRQMQSMSKNMMFALAAPTALGIASAGAWSKLSGAMGGVNTVLDDSSKWMSKYLDQVRALSLYYGEGPENLAKGLKEILSSAIAAEDAMYFLNVAVKTAKAGQTDAATATTGLLDVIHAYGLEARDAGAIADKMFQIVRDGRVEFEELAGYIGLSAGMAHQAGVDLDELLATFGMLTIKGLQFSHAQVALTNILKQVTGATTSMDLALKKYGVDLSFSALQTMGFVGMMRQLSDLPREGILEIFKEMRGQRGAVLFPEGMEDIDRILKAIKSEAGQVDVAFAKMQNTFQMSVQRMKAGGEVILGVIGENLAEPIEKVIFKLISMAKWFKSLGDIWKSLIVWSGKTVIAILALSATLYTAAKAVMFFGIMKEMFTETPAKAMIVIASAIAVTAAAMALFAAATADSVKEMASLRSEVNKMATAGGVAGIGKKGISQKEVTESEGYLEGMRKVYSKALEEETILRNKAYKHGRDHPLYADTQARLRAANKAAKERVRIFKELEQAEKSHASIVDRYALQKIKEDLGTGGGAGAGVGTQLGYVGGAPGWGMKFISQSIDRDNNRLLGKIEENTRKSKKPSGIVLTD